MFRNGLQGVLIFHWRICLRNQKKVWAIPTCSRRIFSLTNFSQSYCRKASTHWMRFGNVTCFLLVLQSISHYSWVGCELNFRTFKYVKFSVSLYILAPAPQTEKEYILTLFRRFWLAIFSLQSFLLYFRQPSLQQKFQQSFLQSFRQPSLQ